MVPLVVPTTEEELRNWDKIQDGKPQKFYFPQRFGRNYRKRSRFTQEFWPQPQNFFYDEDHIKEDEIRSKYLQRRINWMEVLIYNLSISIHIFLVRYCASS